MDFDQYWEDAAGPAAEVLRGRVDRLKILRADRRHISHRQSMRLTATVDGFPVEVSYTEGPGRQGCLTDLWIGFPGWPTSTRLGLRQSRKLLFRCRCIEFEDADWDPYFEVRGTDSDMIRLQLTRERRAAIRDWYKTHDGDMNPVMKTGLITCLIADADETVEPVQQLVELALIAWPEYSLIMEADEIVEPVQQLVELARVITR